MRGYTYQTQENSFFAGVMPPAVKLILIANVVVFLLQVLSRLMELPMELFFGLSRLAYEKWLVYQVFSYMWLHSTEQIMHLLFNMLGIWMFGRELEIVWGTRQFLKYYLICGIGAGIFILILDLLFGVGFSITIGASGALFGLLLASAMSWPDRMVYIYFLFPVKMKWFVAAFGFISFFGVMGGVGGNISHAGHLGGILAGFLYIIYRRQNWGKFFSGKKRRRDGISDAKVVHIRDYRKEPTSFAERTFAETEKRVDELLDRIARHGLHSLTPEERKFLDSVGRDRDHLN